MTAANRSILIATVLLSAFLSAAQGERVWYSETETSNGISQDYESHNIFVVNGTTLTLDNGYKVTAPASSDDGEDAIRVTDATFIGNSGTISGGLGVGGTGVTLDTTRDSEYSPASATFEKDIVVSGGDATREGTTQGGDAVAILQGGSTATFNGGRFTPGNGCTIKVCGVQTDNGVALRVIMGEAIINGGTFEGVIYNLKGDVTLNGCVEYDKVKRTITGYLNDGSSIDVTYDGDDAPKINYNADICPEESPDSTGQGSAGSNAVASLFMYAISLLGFIVNFQ